MPNNEHPDQRALKAMNSTFMRSLKRLRVSDGQEAWRDDTWLFVFRRRVMLPEVDAAFVGELNSHRGKLTKEQQARLRRSALQVDRPD